MNIYKPTGKKLENWPQLVDRLTKENHDLQRRIRELEKQVMELMAQSNG
jgi:predicted RNase H-like nuclease (RuvC/YqgF family)